MLLHFYTNGPLFLLGSATILLMFSLITFHLQRRTIGLVLLCSASLVFGFFVSGLDGFLNIWDEQYHALVAKHMMQQPFRPMLYMNPVLPYDHHNWTSNHVWLHKQPLFLWQMVLSMKVFGVGELAVRIPSILMHALATLMVYRIGRMMAGATIGFYGAVFFAVGHYLLELGAGKYATDHNDAAFLFYVTGSIWAWFEYQRSGRSFWVVLIGLLAGCAVLVKWLVGLLVFAIWLAALGANDRKSWVRIRSYVPIAAALFVAGGVFVPWQLHILNAFPVEAQHEFHLNTAHFFEVVEHHAGDLWFHFKAMEQLYGSGDLVPFLILIGLVLLWKRTGRVVHRIGMVTALLAVYGFYSLAATKMTSFTIIVSPFIFLGLGALTDDLFRLMKKWLPLARWEISLRIVTILIVAYFLFDLPKITRLHTDRKPLDNMQRSDDLAQMRLIGRLSELKQDSLVIFNANRRLEGHIAVMFYTDHVAYPSVPSKEQVRTITEKGYRVAVVDHGEVPSPFRSDPRILIVPDR